MATRLDVVGEDTVLSVTGAEPVAGRPGVVALRATPDVSA
jgi:hypothetical protein